MAFNKTLRAIKASGATESGQVSQQVQGKQAGAVQADCNVLKQFLQCLEAFYGLVN